MTQVCLDRAEDFLVRETPREYVQQLAVASEALRRAKGAPGGGFSTSDLIEEFRAVFAENGG